MFRAFKYRFDEFVSALRAASDQLKKQFLYEVKKITVCPKTDKHLIAVKVVSKAQGMSCFAEEIVADESFLTGFSPRDIRDITYHAVCDKYEAILEKEKIKKSYELIWSRSVDGDKAVTLKNKKTDESITVALKSFTDSNLIEKLDSQDAYNLGYIAGQEQALKDILRLKIINGDKKV